MHTTAMTVPIATAFLLDIPSSFVDSSARANSIAVLKRSSFDAARALNNASF